MTTTLDAPSSSASAPVPNDPEGSSLDQPHDLDSRPATGRDNWSVMMLVVALTALMFSVIAVGFGMRAMDQSKGHMQLATTAATPAPVPVPAAPVALTSVMLSDMKVTPSSAVVAPGSYTIKITNAGTMEHELLVFHTDLAAADLPIGPDGKVNEDAPGFKISDGDNIDPGASQSRVLDLTQPGTYLFVCNIAGHFMAGMHSTVTVK